MSGWRRSHISPRRGRLIHYLNITINVEYRMPERAIAPLTDNLQRTEKVARDIVLNYDQAQTWYPSTRGGDPWPARLRHHHARLADHRCHAAGHLGDGQGPERRGCDPRPWISASYMGYDLAQQIRNFLRAKYPAGEWGIEDVLLVGHYDDVPMRRTSQDVGYGEPETDFYYAELSEPDSASWDSNGNYEWGEDADSVDFYNEVNVGRIPWSTASTVQHICEKSVAYEQNDDPAFKKNILLLGGFFWNDDPNPRTDNAVLMEAKIDQPWMTDWTKTRMYEQNTECYSTYMCDYELLHANVVPVWSAGQFAFVNWAGHGSPTSSHIYGLGAPAFIASTDCPSLNDDYPAIIFADACSNSDTDYLNIGQAMLQQGAVGFVGATKVALGCPGWNDEYDGSSQSMDYFFTAAVTSGSYTQGAAHQWALREMYTNGLWDYVYYEVFEWGALWGNPNLGLGAPPALSISCPFGVPEMMEPGQPTVFTVQISGGTEAYVPGSGLLYYRYDGGTFLTSALVHDTGELYLATLPPAGCDDTPEFYVSADSDGGTTVTAPYGATGQHLLRTSRDAHGCHERQLRDRSGLDRREPRRQQRGLAARRAGR